MVVEIPLTQDRCALIDDDFVEAIGKYKWHAQSSHNHLLWYAVHRRDGGIQMHRHIMSLHLGRMLKSTEIIDHINHNGLDNRLENLRLATHAQNCSNQRVRTGPKTSRYKGVYWEQTKRRWRARIWVGGKRSSLGYFSREEDAALAYNGAALRRFGEYACLNDVAEAI